MKKEYDMDSHDFPETFTFLLISANKITQK